MSGVLQLAEGSHLTIDETHLQAGTLNSVGVENIGLLKNLMKLQKVIFNLRLNLHDAVKSCDTSSIRSSII